MPIKVEGYWQEKAKYHENDFHYILETNNKEKQGKAESFLTQHYNKAMCYVSHDVVCFTTACNKLWKPPSGERFGFGGFL